MSYLQHGHIVCGKADFILRYIIEQENLVSTGYTIVMRILKQQSDYSTTKSTRSSRQESHISTGLSESASESRSEEAGLRDAPKSKSNNEGVRLQSSKDEN